jgi:hypothetical protein
MATSQRLAPSVGAWGLWIRSNSARYGMHNTFGAAVSCFQPGFARTACEALSLPASCLSRAALSCFRFASSNSLRRSFSSAARSRPRLVSLSSSKTVCMKCACRGRQQASCVTQGVTGRPNSIHTKCRRRTQIARTSTLRCRRSSSSDMAAYDCSDSAVHCLCACS